MIDKSAVATVATASAFEEIKGFNGTFKRAYLKYINMLKYLKDNNMIECDEFLLLTANYNVICERNKKRSHVLEGIWVDEHIINKQRNVLEKILKEIVGSISINVVKKQKIDTTNLSKEQTLKMFYRITNDIEEDLERE